MMVADRQVVGLTRLHDRVEGDCFASWITICHNGSEFHPFVVWTVVARPEGWHAEQGDYCKTLGEAHDAYKRRGGR